MVAQRPNGAIAWTFARADLAVACPDRATASLVGDFPRPGAVWAMPRASGDRVLGPMTPKLARQRTPPHGRAEGFSRGQLARSLGLLHGRIWPWPAPTVPRPR